MQYRYWMGGALCASFSLMTAVARADDLPAFAPVSPAPRAASSAAAFDPAIGAVLSGTYAHLSQDPARYALPGFSLGDEASPGRRGLSLGESEVAMSANVDDKFFGNLIFALSPDNQASAEEAYVQTIGLPAAFTVRAGRFFSNIGYLNSQHAHVWDFVDAPLPYRAMLNNQYGDDGVQVRWLAPTDNVLLEFGAEALRGDRFPAGSAANTGGTGTRTAFVHLGGDVGASHSYRLGVSRLEAKANARSSGAVATPDLFTGNSKLTVADLVWKWAPGGNTTVRNFKWQSEYFHRDEAGTFTPATGTAANIDGAQSGWYTQGIYQFKPRWRAGLRYDALRAAPVSPALAGTALDAGGHRPQRVSAMVDFSNSEFSRIRLQFNRDRSQPHVDNQVFVQYLMSIGAHGAHQF